MSLLIGRASGIVVATGSCVRVPVIARGRMLADRSMTTSITAKCSTCGAHCGVTKDSCQPTNNSIFWHGGELLILKTSCWIVWHKREGELCLQPFKNFLDKMIN